MNWPSIVCPHEESLLRSLSGRSILVRVGHLREAEAAASAVSASTNQLRCVIVESSEALEDLDWSGSLQGIPLALHVPSCGRFRKLAASLGRLGSLNARVYLPGDSPGNLAALRILSSLGIHTCVVIGPENTDWDALTDLMTYALLGRVPHAPIEPFAFMAAHFGAVPYPKWKAFYFEEPTRFLHLDRKGRVALSRAGLDAGEFVAQSLEEIASPDRIPGLEASAEAWREVFVQNLPCASCDAWKICGGAFARSCAAQPDCREFFVELIDVIELDRKRARAREGALWQP